MSDGWHFRQRSFPSYSLRWEFFHSPGRGRLSEPVAAAAVDVGEISSCFLDSRQ